MTILRFLFPLLLYSFLGYTQNCDFRFEGQVIDLHDNLPLDKARVYVVETQRELTTNLQGIFVIGNLCDQSYTLLIDHPDCNPLTINISPAFSSEKKFYLEHHINALEEIIITDNKEKSENKTGIERTLSSDEIDRYRSQNFGDAMAQLSGVSKIKTGNNIVKPVIHGVSGSRISIVNNGVRLQDHEWGADHAPSIDISGAKQVQLIKGATALRYGGDAIGGILKISPQKYARIDSLMGVISTGYQDNGRGGFLLSNVVKTYQGGSHLGINTSLKKLGDLSSPEYELTNTGNREQHFGLFFGRNTITQEWKIAYSFFNKQVGILSSAHLGTLGDLARAIKSDVPLVRKPFSYTINSPRQTTSHHNITAQYKNQNPGKLHWEMVYSFQSNQRKEFDVRRGQLSDQAALDIQLQSHDFQFDLESKQAGSWKWKAGLTAQIQDNFSDPNTGVRRLIPDYIRSKLGVYSISEYTPSNNFTAELGVRYDYDYLDAQKYYRIDDWISRGYDAKYQSTIISTTPNSNYLTEQIKKYGNFSGSFGLKQYLGNEIFAFLNLGLITRSPNPSELFSDGLHHALATIERGELSLTQEQAFKRLLSIEKKNGFFKFALSAYMTDIKDYIFLLPTGVDATRSISAIVSEYQQAPKVNMRGFDADLSIQFSDQLSYKAAAAWVEVEEEDGTPLIDIPPFNFSHSLVFKQTKKTPLEILLTSNYVAKQNRYPEVNFEYNFFENGVIKTELIDVSTPPDAYHILGLEVGTQLFNRIDTRVVIDNLTNVTYRNYLNRLRYFAAETGRSIRLEFTYLF